MKTFRHKLFWLIPLTIIIVSLAILYFINLQRFTAPPSENWSRELKIATIDSFYAPQVESKDETTHLYYVEDGNLKAAKYDSNYDLIERNTILTKPKLEDFYVYQDNIILYNDGAILDGATNEELDQATLFQRGTNEQLFYAKGQEVYSLNIETTESNKLFNVAHPIEKIQAVEDLILVYSSNLNRGSFSIYRKTDENTYKQLLQEDINIGVSNQINQIELTAHDQTVYVAVTGESQSTENKKFYFFYSSFPIDDSTVELTQVQPMDPVTNRPLDNLSHVKLRIVDGKLQALFRSVGFTFKDTNDKHAMNIYSINFTGDADSVVQHSNTYSVSSDPMYFGENAVLWKESSGQQKYDLFLSSTSEKIMEQTRSKTMEEYLVAFGISISNLATSAFVLLLVMGWLLIPIVYLIIANIIYRIKGRNHDMNESNLVFFIGVILFVIGALLMRNFLFPTNGYSTAPSYITFGGSSIIYILLFAAIALISVLLVKREWGTIGKYAYFIGIQYLCYLLFLGPFYF